MSNQNSNELIQAQRALLVKKLAEKKRAEKAKQSLSIPSQTRDSGIYPLSFAQQRLWVIDQIEGGSAAYNLPMVLNVEGAFDLAIAEQVLSHIISRHESLRTVFIDDAVIDSAEGSADGSADAQQRQPAQKVIESVEFHLSYHDLRQQAANEQQQSVDALIAQDAQTIFDLRNDLMVRASYLHLSDQQQQEQQLQKQQQGVLLFNMHHIASDAHSMGILIEAFVKGYQALMALAETTASFSPGSFVRQAKATLAEVLPALEIQYRDFACWQRDWLSGKELELQLGYWSKQLAGIPALHQLPLDYVRPASKAWQGQQVTGHIDQTVTERLLAVAKDHAVTPFMLLHAALGLVLSRHANHSDVVLGTPITNRSQNQLAGLIGFFVNTLVLRTETEFDDFASYLAHVKQVNLSAKAHQDVPFDQVLDHLNVTRSNQHTPLFQIMFSMDTQEQQSLNIPGLSFSSLEREHFVARFDLDISAEVSDSGISLSWVYDEALFTETSISALNAHLHNLLVLIGENPAAKLRDLTLLSDEEKHHQLFGLNDDLLNKPSARQPMPLLLHRAFEHYAKDQPENIALTYQGQSISYGELNQRANQLAHYLQQQDVQAGNLVGVCLNRSSEMVMVLLAILKTGAAYVPMDPGHPVLRHQAQIHDSQIRLLLTTQQVSARLAACFEQAGESMPVQCLTLEGMSLNSLNTAVYPKQNPEVELPSDALAYVMYTSGSTGKPKGVVVEHKNVLQLVVDDPCVVIDSTDCVAWCANPAFDASTWEIYVALCSGAQLSIIDDNALAEPSEFAQQLEQDQVSVLQLTAGLFGQLAYVMADTLSRMRYLLFGGDKADLKAVSHVFEQVRPAHLVHTYGPTETVAFTTTYEVNTDHWLAQGRLPIGRHTGRSSCYVLDKHHQLLPFGSVGELYIGGDGVARGYLNQADLTRERFIQNPFSQNSQDRLYKTGDLVRYLADGTLEFIGRMDEQVKVRGFRIELAEIEFELRQLAVIDRCVVLAIADEHGHKQLVAYVIAANSAIEDEAEFVADIRQALQQKLPEFMLPTAFVVLSEFPLTANGKVDKRALPAPETAKVKTRYIAPTTETERQLAAIWSDLLATDEVSSDAHFFESGGHSLTAIRLVNEIREQMAKEITVKAVFEKPTLKALASLVDSQSEGGLRQEIVAIERHDNRDLGYPLSFAQQRLWFIDQLQGGSVEYNMPMALAVDGAFDVTLAEQAMVHIITRHETLRTTFSEFEGQPQQIIRQSFDFTIEQQDLSALSAKEQQRKISQLCLDNASYPFDLSTDLMVRVSYLKLSRELCDDAQPLASGILLFNMHHIASDGWSIAVLIREFTEIYQALSAGTEVPLAPLSVQYVDYAKWQRDWLSGETLQKQLDYWQQQLMDVPVVHSLPLDYARPEQKAHVGAYVTASMDASISRQLEQIAMQHQVTPFMLLHGALALVLSSYGSTKDVVIGTVVANRSHSGLDDLIGFFVNTLVLRTDLNYHTFADFLQHVKQVNLAAQANQDIPFEQLVDHTQVPRSVQHTPLFQILLSTDTIENAPMSLNDVSFAPVDEEAFGIQPAAKFDLELNTQFSADGLGFQWTYDTSIFTEATVSALQTQLELVLNLIVSKPQALLSELSALPTQETERLVHQFNPFHHSAPECALLHHGFEAQVQRLPQQTAVTFEGQSLSYQALNASANQLARWLREQGVKSNTLVGLCVGRSVDMVIGVLGILKAGGAYVPMDPTNPTARLQYVIEDTQMQHLITDGQWPQGLAIPQNVVTLDLSQSQLLASFASNNLTDDVLANTDIDANALAYVIYTSGSTGKPKGVLQTHHNVTRLFSATDQDFGFNSQDVWTLFHSIAFDFSVWELWGALLFGGKLVVVSQSDTRDTESFIALCQQHKVTVLNQTPTAFKYFAEQSIKDNSTLPDLRYVVFGGEALQVDSLLPWWQHVGEQQPQLINMYGITETTVHVTFKALSKKDIGHSVIGHALADQTIYLLDDNRQLVPQGAVGEVYVGGAGLAQGYLNLPEQTRQHFVDNPYATNDMLALGYQRMYKTGDIARYTRSGELVHLGRNDSQVKIRGFRIELAEIAKALNQLADIKDAMVLTQLNHQQEPMLVAYGIASGNEQRIMENWRAELSAQIPAYMLPAELLLVEQWPLTANGKIDSKRLPSAADVSHHNYQSAFAAPKSKEEQLIAEVWAKVLGVETSSISRHDNFFALGGHSLLIIRYRALLSEHGVELPVAQLYQAQTVSQLAKLLRSRDSHQHSAPALKRPAKGQPLTPELFEMLTLTPEQLAQIIAEVKGGEDNVQDIYPLSPLQQGMLFHALESPEDDPYVIKTLFQCDSQSAYQAFVEALNFVIARHDALRTQIVSTAAIEGLGEALGGAVQVVCRQAQLVIDTLSIPQHISEPQDIQQWLLTNPLTVTPDAAPLMRLQVAQQGDCYYLLLAHHHLIEDNWSSRVLQTEIEALVSGQADSLPEPVQYREFIWHGLQTDPAQAQSYFTDLLAGYSDITSPFGLSAESFERASDMAELDAFALTLPEGMVSQLYAVAHEQQVSVVSLFHLAWALVIAGTSGQQDVVFGSVLSGRMQGIDNIDRIVGLCINTLPLRVQLAQTSVAAGLSDVHEALSQLIRYEQTSLSQVQSYSEMSNLTPLFNTILNCRLHHDGQLLAQDQTDEQEASGVDLSLLAMQDHTNYPLSASIDYSKDTVVLKIESINCIAPQSVAEYLKNALSGILTTLSADSASRSDRPLIDLPLMDKQHLDYLLYDLNQRSPHERSNERPDEQLVHEVVEAKVAQQPEAIAIAFAGQQMCYGELNQKANQLARHLRAQGVTANTLVGIYLKPSFELVISVLAVLKAGGAYVPFDHNHPAHRLEYMIEDTGLCHLLSEKALYDTLNLDTLNLADSVTVTTPNSESYRLVSEQLETTNLTRLDTQHRTNRCYVVYTSGSTGQPKGVVLPHQLVVNLISGMARHSDRLAKPLKMVQYASFGFDMSVTDMFMSFFTGGCLQLIDSAQQKDLQQLAQLINTESVGRLNLPYAVLQQLAIIANEQQITWPGLEVIISTAEGLRVTPDIRQLFKRHPHCQLVNHYGPSETHVVTGWALQNDVDNWPAEPPIGTLLPNLSAYVLDANRQPVPYGCIGELYIGGVGLALEYLNQPEMTTDKFINHCFNNSFNESDSAEQAQRLYRTGDLVRFINDDCLAYIGRNDDQVKIRGFRIEIGEIEHQLSLLPTVKTAVVVAHKAPEQAPQLIAYVVPDNDQSQQQSQDSNQDITSFNRKLRKQLQHVLPHYMVPALFVQLDELPLTTNGKVDKRKLPQPDTSLVVDEYVAANTSTEQSLLSIWASLLKLDETKISVTANFFELGGHSLLVVRLVGEIRAVFGVECTITTVFEQSDIRSLAQIIDQESSQTAVVRPTLVRRTVEKAQRNDNIPLSFAQQRLWFIDRLQGGSVQYNLPMALGVRGAFDVDCAEQAMARLIERHESLRTVFAEKDGAPVQVIRDRVDFAITRYDLSGLQAEEQTKQMTALMREDANTPFDLAEDVIVRCGYINLADPESADANSTQGVLLFNMHHIASDGWSMGVLISEFMTIYLALSQHREPELAPLDIQYADYAIWHRQWVETGDELDNQLDYWKNQLQGVPLVHSLPLDFNRPEVKNTQGKVVSGEISAEVFGRLQQLAREHQMTMYMLLHSALALVLSRNSNSHDIVIGTSVANRMQKELEPLIGFFVNTLVLRTDTRFDTLSDYLAHVKTVNLQAQSHQDITFEQLVEHLKIQRSTRYSPLFQIMFNLNNNEQSESSIPDVDFSVLDSGITPAKFDLEVIAEVSDIDAQINWVYDTAIFSEHSITQLSQQLVNILNAMSLAKPQTDRLDTLELLSSDHKTQLLQRAEGPVVDLYSTYSNSQSFVDLFEQQVVASPANIAVQHGDESLSYQELNEQANQLAGYLAEQNITTGDLLGICVEPAPDLLVSLLAIAKVGAAWVPIDPRLPEQRIQTLITEAGLSMLLTQMELMSQLSLEEITVLPVDESMREALMGGYSVENSERSFDPQTTLAYVIYTSGSTGVPKGVMVHHHGLFNYLDHAKTHYMEAQIEGSVVSSAFSFDATLTTLITPLLLGKKVELLPQDNSVMTLLAQRLFNGDEALLFKMTPSLMQALAFDTEQQPCQLQHQVVVGGEQFGLDNLLRWKQQLLPQATFVNEYGPTETVVGCSTFTYADSIAADDIDSVNIIAVPIGTPIQNTRLLVLDKAKQLVPSGAVGELYIGGDGVTLGYLNQPEKTQQCFIDSDDEGLPQGRYYQTGDLVRALPDGNLMFIGRIDEQVKLRGYRIEVAEIEYQLNCLSEVSAASVIVTDTGSEQAKLLAYVVPAVAADNEQNQIFAIKSQLQQQLPEYMLPSAYIMMESLPLTINGKIDKNALPAPADNLLAVEYSPPVSEVECQLTDIWADILNIAPEQISLYASFFDLGGQSLLAVKLTTQIKHDMDVTIELAQVFEHPTLQALAVVVEKALTLKYVEQQTANTTITEEGFL